MTSMFGGRGTEDGPIAPAFAPGDVDGVRRVMTLCGAWLRRLRSPVVRAGSSRIGGNRSAARRCSDRSGRPESSGCVSAAGRGIAGALHGICRLSRAAVPALVGLTLLAGVATQASAQTLPTVSFEPNGRLFSAYVSEGERADVKLTLDPAPTSDITVKYTVVGDAIPGFDYTALSGTVTVPKGAKSATIPVTFIDDDMRERMEVFGLKLIKDTGYRVARPHHDRVYILLIDPVPWVSLTRRWFIATEGSGTFGVEVALNPAPTSDITIEYRLDGCFGRETTHGSDFTIGRIGTLSVPKGAKSATIPMTIIDDGVPEGRECYYLQLVGSKEYQVGTYSLWGRWEGGHVDIIDGPTRTASFTSASQSAGEGSGTHDVEVTLDPAPTTDIALDYTVEGTATAGSDYAALSGSVTVLAGAKTATIPVTLIDDSVHEGSETVVLTLTAGAGYAAGSPGTHTLTIVDDEPTVAFASASQSAVEGPGTHDVEVTLSTAPATDLTLAYTVGGTATSGSDYTALSGSVTVLAGTATATIPVTLIDDSLGEVSETVVLTLAEGEGYGVGSPGTHTLTILDDETPAVSFASASQDAFEWSGTRDVEVTLSTAPATDITLSYTVGGTATSGSDYTALSGSVTVPAHATTATIPVTLIDDDVPESNETVVLTLAGSAAYSVVSPATHTLTIVANDAQPPATSSVSFASGTYRVNEGGALRPVLVLSHWRSEAVTVVVEALDLGEAQSGTDFAADPWRVTIPAGETRHTFSIATFDDASREGDEQLLLHIAPSGHSPGIRRSTNGHPDAVAYIIDDTRVSLPETEYTVTEGATATIRVTIANPKPAPFTLDYTLSGAGGASGADVAGGLGTRSVTVAANAKGVSFPIETVQDTEPGEVGESVEVELSTTESDVVFAARRAVVHIADDDSPAVTFAAAASRAGEGAGIFAPRSVMPSASPPPRARARGRARMM